MPIEDRIDTLNNNLERLISALEGANSLAAGAAEAESTKPNKPAKAKKAPESVEEEPVAGEVVDDDKLTAEDIKKAFMDLVQMTGKGRANMEKVLKQFKAEKFTDLKPKQYPAVMDAIEEEKQA